MLTHESTPNQQVLRLDFCLAERSFPRELQQCEVCWLPVRGDQNRQRDLIEITLANRTHSKLPARYNGAEDLAMESQELIVSRPSQATAKHGIPKHLWREAMKAG